MGLGSILLFGLVLKTAGFLVRDELVLRAFVIGGMACDISFFYLQPDPIWRSVATNSFLAAINFGIIIAIIFERTTLSMTDQQKRLYAAFPTLKPGQFRRIVRHATWHDADERTRIIEDGTAVEQLFFVKGSHFEIVKAGQSHVAQGPAFAGELVFLKGGVSSADVWLDKGARYVSFPTKALKREMKRSPALHNAMIALFGVDLAHKVANSVPMSEELQHKLEQVS